MSVNSNSLPIERFEKIKALLCFCKAFSSMVRFSQQFFLRCYMNKGRKVVIIDVHGVMLDKKLW